ncbi:hypothetical protein WME91_06415 [Sorangium sp. So ce269]
MSKVAMQDVSATYRELRERACMANMEIPGALARKHFYRKHGNGAYYGQE